ncbi:hypothetical protein PTE30175_05608 [Pandoraea terrae]|uniref:Uncharacterized protein n=1 Tax=Pandoraea terrae TaxID=1537710 RepID=A0A5E4ZE88_9BURK|nr:hypothetical protein PTE30175_05608 [Pandoraea terrae]
MLRRDDELHRFADHIAFDHLHFHVQFGHAGGGGAFPVQRNLVVRRHHRVWRHQHVGAVRGVVGIQCAVLRLHDLRRGEFQCRADHIDDGAARAALVGVGGVFDRIRDGGDPLRDGGCGRIRHREREIRSPLDILRFLVRRDRGTLGRASIPGQRDAIIDDHAVIGGDGDRHIASAQIVQIELAIFGIDHGRRVEDGDADVDLDGGGRSPQRPVVDDVADPVGYRKVDGVSGVLDGLSAHRDHNILPDLARVANGHDRQVYTAPGELEPVAQRHVFPRGDGDIHALRGLVIADQIELDLGRREILVDHVRDGVGVEPAGRRELDDHGAPARRYDIAGEDQFDVVPHAGSADFALDEFDVARPDGQGDETVVVLLHDIERDRHRIRIGAVAFFPIQPEDVAGHHVPVWAGQYIDGAGIVGDVDQSDAAVGVTDGDGGGRQVVERLAIAPPAAGAGAAVGRPIRDGGGRVGRYDCVGRVHGSLH